MGPEFEFKWKGWTLTATILEDSDEAFTFDLIEDDTTAEICALLSVSFADLEEKVAATLQRQVEDFVKIYYYDPEV